MMGNEHQPLNEEGEDWGFPSGKELGALFMAKRKEMGLTYAQISEQIKVKARYLEALENGDWDHLPSPTFIKGFIRSYARFLGLSEEGLIGLYQEIAPPSQPMPRPIQATAPKRKKGPLYLMLVFAVLAGGFAVYEWIGRPALREKTTEQGPARSAGERSTDTPMGQDVRLEREEAPSNEAQRTPGLMEPDRKPPQEGPAPAPVPQETPSVDKPGEAPLKTVKQVSPLQTGRTPEAERPVPDAASAPERDMPPLTLKANVRERTWVRVKIDDQRPKEYTLTPESSPEWRAHKGFELLIGNAGGIDLEFNGKKMENLGKQGQVIKLRLPSGDERGVSTD